MFFCNVVNLILFFEVSRHKVPPHNRAAGVQVSKQAQKKNAFTSFWLL